MATSKKRDEQGQGNDWFTIIFDSFNDKENGLVFATNPLGLRNDYTIFKDAMTVFPEMPFNDSWNTFWDVKTSRNDKGWFVEMRIPFSSLRFKESNGTVKMGVICFRNIARKNETDIYPAIPPNWGMFSNYRPSKAQEIVFEGVHSKKPFYIAPYAIGGFQQDFVLNDAGTAYQKDEKPKLTGGLDVKYGLTNNLTLDATFNTDFAQVEADDQMVNLTRFDLFFPEKRTFFQERSSIFSFDFDQGSSLFYSRRIGLYEGEQVPIYGGARVTGMAGIWDIGFLDMQTQAYKPMSEDLVDLPSENFGILRLRRNIINDNSFAGGILTSRIGTDGSYNTAYGLDGIFKVFGNDYLTLKLAQVMDDSSANKPLSLDPTNLFIDWKRFNDNGLGYNLTYLRSGKDFNSKMGFQMRNNYSYYSGGISYGWLPPETSPFMSHKFELMTREYTDNLSGKTQSFEGNISYFFQTKSAYGAYLGLNHQYENVTDTFDLSDNVHIPSGTYSFDLFEFHSGTPQSKLLSAQFDGWIGKFYDGRRISVGFEPQWNPSSFLQLKIRYEYTNVLFNAREQEFISHITSLKALLMFSTKLSISSYIQYSSADNNITSNLRLRYNPKEGNDFYIVVNEGRNTNINREYPVLPEVYNRAILVKYTYTFVL